MGQNAVRYDLRRFNGVSYLLRPFDAFWVLFDTQGAVSYNIGRKRPLKSQLNLYWQGESNCWICVIGWLKNFTSPPHITKRHQVHFLTKDLRMFIYLLILNGATNNVMSPKCQREHSINGTCEHRAYSFYLTLP
jgi:hypothetical protein